MKKHLRFFGMALLATALLFTACSKDDDDDNGTSNKTPTDNTPTRSYDIGFLVIGEGAQDTIIVEAGDSLVYGEYNAVYRNITDDSILYHVEIGVKVVNGYVRPAIIADLVHSASGWAIDAVSMYENKEHATELTIEAGNNLTFDWMKYQTTKGGVSAYDEANHKVSLAFYLDMVSRYDIFKEVAEPSHKTVLVNLENVTFQPWPTQK